MLRPSVIRDERPGTRRRFRHAVHPWTRTAASPGRGPRHRFRASGSAADLGDATELKRTLRPVEDEVDARQPLGEHVAHGLRTPGTMRYTTFWLFHRNCPPGTVSASISSSSSSTSGFQAVFLPGGKPLRERCHFWPSTFQGITSSGFVSIALGELLEAGHRSFDERPERGRVDFLPRVGVDLHFLPRAAQCSCTFTRGPRP